MRKMNRLYQRVSKTSVMVCHAGLLVLISALICLGGCSPKHSSYSDFRKVSAEGWSKQVPFVFVPQYGDSTGVYDVEVALCYAHDYPYRNISVVLDFVKGDSLIHRSVVDCMLTDVNGNWQTSGFGVAYQSKHEVRCCVRPKDYDRIEVWHGLSCDTLRSVTRVGVTVKPSAQ